MRRAVGLMVIVLVGACSGASDVGSPSSNDAPSIADPRVNVPNFLGRLEEDRSRVSGLGGGLAYVRLTEPPDPETTPHQARAEIGDVLWSARKPLDTGLAVLELAATSGVPPLDLPIDALALISNDGRIWDIAGVDEDGRIEYLPGLRGFPNLAGAMDQLRDQWYRVLEWPSPFGCDTAPAPRKPERDDEAMALYLEEIGGILAEKDRHRAAWQRAQAIAHARGPAWVDDYHLQRQLIAGVPEDELEIRPMAPVEIVIPGLAEDPSKRIVVFENDEYLGLFRPNHYKRIEPRATVYLIVPTPGSTVSIFADGGHTGNPVCPGWLDGKEPIAAIPAAEFAGYVDLSDWPTTPTTTSPPTTIAAPGPCTANEPDRCPDWQLSRDGLGPIAIGDTVDQVRAALLPWFGEPTDSPMGRLDWDPYGLDFTFDAATGALTGVGYDGFTPAGGVDPGFTTPDGIGLGATRPQLEAAYPYAGWITGELGDTYLLVGEESPYLLLAMATFERDPDDWEVVRISSIGAPPGPWILGPESFGPIHLGDHYLEARGLIEAWLGPPRDEHDLECGTSTSWGGLRVTFHSFWYDGSGSGEVVAYWTGNRKLATPEGISIESTVEDVLAAYPTAEEVTSPGTGWTWIQVQYESSFYTFFTSYDTNPGVKVRTIQAGISPGYCT